MKLFAPTYPRTRLRDVLALGVLAGLLLVCGAAARDAATRPVRFVDRLDHEQLVEWLSTRDLQVEFTSTRLRLARRLAEDLRQGYDWQDDIARLDEQRRQRWLENSKELVRVWLLERADRYAALAMSDRTDFVDEQLDDLLYWPIWQRRGHHDLHGLLPRNPALAVQQFHSWMGELPGSESQRIEQFTNALYLRWLQRGFHQIIPGGA